MMKISKNTGKLNNKGFTITEIIFVIAIILMVMGSIVASWSFAYKTWNVESKRTKLRMGLLKAVEIMKNDIRLSNIAKGGIVFSPEIASVYSSVSIPLAVADDTTGLFSLDPVTRKIKWDKTVMYHIYTDSDGNRTLRRTVYDGVLADESDRRTQLETVVANGGGTGADYETADMFLTSVDGFSIYPISGVVDFYDESQDPVRADNIEFGWGKISDGDHTIRLEIVEKNPLSSGNTIGLDTLIIEPSGSEREAEFYEGTGMINTSGGSAYRINGEKYLNNQYLEFSPSGTGSYVEFTDHYDLWRESSFMNVSVDNAELEGFPMRAVFKAPEDDEEGDYSWSASDETGSIDADSELLGSGGFGTGQLPPIVIRTVVTSPNVVWSRPIIRVNFKASSLLTLNIDKAYITKRNGTQGPDGLENIDPTGVPDPAWEDYHHHQQLLFKDSVGNITENVSIAQGTDEWSMWTAFPLEENTDYLITMYVSNGSSIYCKYWAGLTSDIRTYYMTLNGWINCTVDNTTNIITAPMHGFIDGDMVALRGTPAPVGVSSPAGLSNLVGTPIWNFYYVINSTADDFQISATYGGTPVDIVDNGTNVEYHKLPASNNIYISAAIDTWDDKATITSNVFDTSVSAPGYGTVEWNENAPAGTNVSVKVRSNSDPDILSLQDWASAAEYDNSGSGLAIGNGRYLQFRAQVESDPVWKTGLGVVSYSDYVADQSDNAPYDFPKDGSGDPYFTGIYSSWVDDIKVDWDGQERICQFKGNIIKKNDFGRAMVTIDGHPLLKTLKIEVSVKDEINGKVITEENVVEIEPRNTGN